MTEIVFEGLANTEQRILELTEELGYLSLYEVTGRNSSALLARMDFNPVDLLPYLVQDGGEVVDPDDATPAELAAAAARWLRRTAADNLTGRAEAKFKVMLWRPKGDANLHSARFIARNPAWDEDDEAPLVPIPTVSAPPAPGVLPPEERVWVALGEGYTRLIALSQGTYSHIAGLQNTTIVSLNAQNQRLQKLVEELSGDLIQLKIGAYEAETGRRADDGEVKVREELARQFVSELGLLGRALASAKLGVPPELAELVSSVGESPELMEALKSPEVRKLLRDDKTRKELAELLKMAAAAPANPPPPPPEQAQAA